METTTFEDLVRNGSVSAVPVWSRVMDDSVLGLTLIGVIANFVSFVTLIRHGHSFQPETLILFRHQSFIDMVACIFGALLLTLPYMWLTGLHWLDQIICHGWHGQAIYWSTMMVSIWNLVIIAYERYLTVCQPFRRNTFNKQRAMVFVVAGYPFSVMFTFGAYLQTHLSDDGTCVSEFFFKGTFGTNFMMGFAISTFFTFYAIPTVMFFTFYGLVLHTFHQRTKESHLASSSTIDKASRQLTKTAIVVTTIFFIALGYDLWYYVLGYTGVTEYKVNSPVQKIGVLFATCNSVANPFVYALLMPAYRKAVWQTVACCNKTTSSKFYVEVSKSDTSNTPV